MAIPETNMRPPFNVTRASHMVLTSADVGRARDFYTEVIGLIVTAEADGAVYLRGVEESAHHSLTLKPAEGEPVCETIGFRVMDDAELDHAKAAFDAAGVEAAFVEVPFQGRTLRVRDAIGIPVEFCASMPPQKRLHDQFQLQRGAAALRLDHYQVLAPDVVEASRFYTDIGFRISDYFVDGEDDVDPIGIFMYRKNNPHDMVFLTRPGPVLHHVGYIVADSAHLFRALDTAAAVGFQHTLERGPGRHGEGHALYVYFRDPDGHRVEILPPPIQMGDIDDAPARWNRANRHSWDLPAPKTWLYEGTRFAGTEVRSGPMGHGLQSLEDFLAAKNAGRF